ncbi:alpha/beta fold hydrolase [Flexithrix dorotheae]|uniref:alpha/beta fold hydrolase n=1 Tax=Flexithrix dorotheae TaxID=70993 RepID=UPI000373945B|nr:alpha/beta hydrolase [Flexithrix dorotheae]
MIGAPGPSDSPYSNNNQQFFVTELIQKYTNEHSRFLPVKGTLIHYRKEGRGPNLLLLHGSFSSLHTFDEWTKILSKKFTVIRLDLPAFGLTGPMPNDQYNIPTYLRYIDCFLRMLKIEKVSIAGSSLGGWIAWEYALQFPKKVKKLILIDAAGFITDNQLPLPFRMAKTPFLNKVIKFVIRKSLLEDFVREVYFNKSKVTQELADRYYDLFTREGNPEAFLKMVNSRYKDNSNHLKDLKVPTLILWGKEDCWIPVANAYRFHEIIPTNDLIIYDLVGHLPMEEIPEDSALDVTSFLLG